MAPEALRVAGLLPALSRLGLDVSDGGNLQGPPNPEQPPRQGYRHLPECVQWNRAAYHEVGEALRTGAVPLLMGGDQIYSDDMWVKLPELQAWSELPWPQRITAPFTASLRNALAAHFSRLYLDRWSQPEVAALLGSVPTVIVTVREGARAVDPRLLDVARAYRLSRRTTFVRVYLPQLVPYLMAAARSGLSLIWKIVLVFEVLGSDGGVGFRVSIFFQSFDILIVKLISMAMSFANLILAINTSNN